MLTSTYNKYVNNQFFFYNFKDEYLLFNKPLKITLRFY